MAASPPQHPHYGQFDQAQYSQEQYPNGQQENDEQMFPSQGQPAPAPGGRKKRAYAGQAYEFGAGANSALGGQQVGGGIHPGPGGQYASYPQQPQQEQYQQPTYGHHQQPGYGMDPTMQVPSYGQSTYTDSGYQSSPPDYHSDQKQPPSISTVTQGMGSLDVRHQAPPRKANQLYPMDLLNQPFNVGELDLPPPPIMVSDAVCHSTFSLILILRSRRRIVLDAQTRIARLNMSDVLSMPFLQRTHCAKNLACLLHCIFSHLHRCMIEMIMFHLSQIRL